MNATTARLARPLSAASLVLAVALPTSAQTTLADGFQGAGSQPSPVLFSSTATLSTGERVVFDGLTVDLYDASGAFLANLATLPAFVFNSFVEVDPTETFVVIGESSNGDLLRVMLDGSGTTVVANLTNNYDAVFATATELLVSAGTCGFGCGNDLLRVDLGTGTTTPLATLPGASGPVALSANGDLYTVVVDFLNPGTSRLVAYTDAQLDAGTPLVEADAALLLGGLAGGASLAVDPVFGNLFLAESSFGATSRILEIAPDGTVVDVVVESDLYLGGLELFQGGGKGHFHRYQPSGGVGMRYSRTDFNALDEIATILPAQPQASFSQSGPVAQLTVTGGVPDGAMLVVFTANANHDPTLVTTVLPGTDFQFHAAASPNRLRRTGPFLLPLDATGTGTFTYFDPGPLAGTQTFQALVADPGGVFLGGSTVAQN